MANSEGPEQAAPRGAVRLLLEESTLFAQAYLSENL